MRKSMLCLIVVLGLVGVLAAPAVAGPERPFKTEATLVAMAEVDDVCAIPGTPVTFSGDVSEYTGTGTHLGRFTLTETLCFFGPPVYDEALGAMKIQFTVDGVFEAANGDLLEYFVDAYFVLPGGPVLEGGFDFTGGTGRFASVAGSGSTALMPDGITQRGWISY